MAVKKFYSNKKKAGWRDNPQHAPAKSLPPGVTQKDNQKRYYSWGYDIDLEAVVRREDGTPKRKRARESGFASSRDAEQAAAKVKFSEKGAKYDFKKPALLYPALGDVFQKIITTIPERQEKVRAVRVLQLLLDALDEAGYADLRLNQLTTAHINLYVERRRKNALLENKSVKDETINRDLRTVRATLNKPKNFYAGIENFVPPKINFLKVEKTRREKILRSEEVQLIVNYLMATQREAESESKFLSRRRAGLLFSLSAVTGARPGELVALREDDILEDINALKITGKKTRYRTAKTVRYFPLINVVRMILAKALEIKICEYIFSRKGTLTQTYYENVKNACESVGLSYGRKTIGGIIPYDLRHTATTLLMQSGADFETVTNITGQSRHTLWHYTHASRESIDRAASVLGNFAEKALEISQFGLSLDKDDETPEISLVITANKNRL